MKKTQQLYEGKAKKVYATDVEGIYIVDYKDDATAFNGEKKGTIAGKGVINNRVTNYLMKMLEEKGIPTHFVEQLSDRETEIAMMVSENFNNRQISTALEISEGTVRNYISGIYIKLGAANRVQAKEIIENAMKND